MSLFLKKGKGDDNLARTEQTFLREVWPGLETLRKRDKSIVSYDKSFFGKDQTYWQLK
jgi:hypothetical protein